MSFKDNKRLSALIENIGSKGILKRDSKTMKSKKPKVSFINIDAIDEIREFDESDEINNFYSKPKQEQNYKEDEENHQIKLSPVKHTEEKLNTSIVVDLIDLEEKKEVEKAERQSIKKVSLINRTKEKEKDRDNKEDTDIKIRLNKVGGSVQKMRETIAGLKKPKVLINNINKQKRKERESMPNFFANTIITDDDLLLMDDDIGSKVSNAVVFANTNTNNNPNINIKENTEQQVINESLLDKSIQDIDLNNSLLTINDIIEAKIKEDIHIPSLEEELLIRTKSIQEQKNHDNRVSTNMRNEMTEQSSLHNLELESLINYTKQQISIKQIEIEEEVKRKELFQYRIERITDKLNENKQMMKEKEKQLKILEDSKQEIVQMTSLINTLKQLGVIVFTEQGKLTVTIMNFVKYSFLYSAYEDYNKVLLKDLQIILFSNDYKEEIIFLLSSFANEKFFLNTEYFLDELLNKIKQIIKQSSPLGYFFTIVIPTLSIFKPNIITHFRSNNELISTYQGFIKNNTPIVMKLSFNYFNKYLITIESLLNINTILSLAPEYTLTNFTIDLLTSDESSKSISAISNKIKSVLLTKNKHKLSYLDDKSFLIEFYSNVFNEIINILN